MGSKLCIVCNGQVLDMRAMKSAQLVDFVHAGCTVLDKNTGIIQYHLFLLLFCHEIYDLQSHTPSFVNNCGSKNRTKLPKRWGVS